MDVSDLTDNANLLNLTAIAIQSAGVDVSQAVASINFSGVEVTVDSTGSHVTVRLPNSYNTSSSNNVQHHEFINTSVWLVQHNMDTRFFVARLSDTDGNSIYASTTIIDNNSFIINLTESTSGSADVMFNTIL